MEGILIALNSSSFMFFWDNKKQYICVVKYLLKTYAYIITDWNTIIKKGKEYTSRDELVKFLKKDMLSLWFKGDEEEKETISLNKLENEINLFFETQKKEDLSPIKKLDALENTKVVILCWLPWSGKTHYYMDNYKTPFVKFFNSYINPNSYKLNLKNWKANDYIKEYDFQKLYSIEDLKDEIDVLREKSFIPFYLYINLDFLVLESTISEIPWERYSNKDYLTDNDIYQYKFEKNKLMVLEKILDKVFKNLKKGADIIIDWKFTSKEEYIKIVKILNKYEILKTIEFVFFENNKELCLENNRIRTIKGENDEDWKYETIVDAKSTIENSNYDFLTETLKLEISKENKEKKQILFKEQKIIPAPKHPFYSLWEIKGSYPSIWWNLKGWIQIWEFKKYLYSEHWRGAWTHFWLDWEETGTSEGDEKNSFNNLNRLIEFIAKKANIKIDKSKIEDLKDLYAEEQEKDMCDPYSNCPTYVYSIDLDIVKTFLEKEWVDFSKLNLNPKVFEKFRLSDWL